MLNRLKKYLNKYGDFQFTENGFIYQLGNSDLIVTWDSVETIYSRISGVAVNGGLQVFKKTGEVINIQTDHPKWSEFSTQCKLSLKNFDCEFDTTLSNYKALFKNRSYLQLVYDYQNRSISQLGGIHFPPDELRSFNVRY